MSDYVGSKLPFERLSVSKKFALEMFSYNPFKLHILNQIPEGEEITLYKCGDFIDLCRGPHIMNTGQIKSISLFNSSSSYWLGDSNREVLQRVYGISFPEKKVLLLLDKY
jgi:threonyl-tRNA synthetase